MKSQHSIPTAGLRSRQPLRLLTPLTAEQVETDSADEEILPEPGRKVYDLTQSKQPLTPDSAKI